jgi:glucose/arabinose dehydrogenase
MRFYTGTMFPEKYRGGVFIAEHGSWNRSSPVGYRVSFVGLRGNDAMSYEMFAEGWLRGAVAWGRPADVLVLPDGSLLVSDDKAGRIYRISYTGPR